MTEADVIAQLVQQTEILLEGVAVFFTIISVYLAGLNFVLSEESVLTRIIAFVFATLALAMLGFVMLGAQYQHEGLIARLRDLEALGELTAAGRAALGNGSADLAFGALHVTLDELIVYLLWGAGALVYLALIHLTFFYRWRPSPALHALHVSHR